MKTAVKFLNHSSVVISGHGFSLLCDPWFSGSSFNDGWNLLYRFSDSEIDAAFEGVTHIWISHEHPDHFSVPFFQKYKKKIIDQNIGILFQSTSDGRVAGFLRGIGLHVTELKEKIPLYFNKDASISVYKFGFYDSALLIKSGSDVILNLNDCDIGSEKQSKEIIDSIEHVDLLLTQFSYAAWKGGKENDQWRKRSANEKIDLVRLQTKIFQPKKVLLFASYAFFSNEQNAYMNDNSNSPEKVYRALEGSNTEVVVASPFDVIGGKSPSYNTVKAIDFWNSRISESRIAHKHSYESISFIDLNKSFKSYVDRIMKNNSQYLMKFINIITLGYVFGKVKIHLIDSGETISIDIFTKQLKKVDDQADIAMHSNSLHFIFKNSFGFDTLTVNGCFEESRPGGFLKVAKSLALENLNNLGVRFDLTIFLKTQIYGHFFRLAKKVGSNL
jgi:hypothetical protein